MNLLKGITKITLSPLNAVGEVCRDLKGDNGEDQKGLSILTCGMSSIAKGLTNGIKSGVDDIFKF